VSRRLGALTLSEHDPRVLAVWAADCAERTLPLFETRAPKDPRPREAIDGLRAFARDHMRIGKVRALAARAHTAARETKDSAATAAARAAGQAASVSHMAAHGPGAAAYARRPWGWPRAMLRPPSKTRFGGNRATPRQPFGISCGDYHPRPAPPECWAP
jgi:hypothetical protein